MQDNFSGEVDLCGIFKFDDCSDAEAHMEEILTNVDITDNPILLKCQRDGDDFGIKASQWKNGKLEQIEYEIFSEEMIYTQFTMVRLLGYIEIAAEANERSIKHEFQSMRKKLAFGNVLFQIKNQKVFMNNNNIVGMKMESLISDLLDIVKKKGESDGDESSKKKQKDIAPSDFQFVNIDCLIKKSDENEKNQRAAMNFVLEKNKILIPIKIDAIAALHLTTKALALYDILVESLCRYKMTIFVFVFAKFYCLILKLFLFHAEH